MQRLVHGLRKTIGILFTATGFFASVVGVCWFVLFVILSLRGEYLSAKDHLAWRVCGIGTLVAMLVLGAGILLLREIPTDGSTNRSLRLTRSPAQRRRSVHKAASDTVSWLVIGAGFLWVCSDGDPLSRALQIAVGVVAIYLGLHAIVLCHELGHLGVAGLLGMDLQKLQVGTGPRMINAMLGDLRVEWRLWYGGGLIHAADARERGWRRRHWLCVAGGPAAHAVACAALGTWLWSHLGCRIVHRAGDLWLDRLPIDNAGAVALFLFFIGVYSWLFSLWPRRATVGSVRSRTDGYQLLHTFKFSDAAVRDIIIVTRIHRAEMLWEEGRREDAWRHLRSLEIAYPAHPALAFAEGFYRVQEEKYAAAAASFERGLEMESLSDSTRRPLTLGLFASLARAGDLQRARSVCDDALERCTPPSRPEMLDALATTVLAYKVTTFLADADAWSQEMVSLEPQSITRKGTRGSVLVELGRLEEAEPLLREVWIKSPGEVDAAISAFYLALMAKRRGREREMRIWRQRAENFAPFAGKWLVRRLEDELV